MSIQPKTCAISVLTAACQYTTLLTIEHIGKLGISRYCNVCSDKQNKRVTLKKKEVETGKLGDDTVSLVTSAITKGHGHSSQEDCFFTLGRSRFTFSTIAADSTLLHSIFSVHFLWNQLVLQPKTSLSMFFPDWQ